VGSFFEFYHADDKQIANSLGLLEIGKNKRSARYGFPISLMYKQLQQLINQKVSVTVMLEQGRYVTRIKERVPVYRFECLAGGLP